jgi:hypothetical protein
MAYRPAFPVKITDEFEDGPIQHYGMSLRDYFAGQLLSGMPAMFSSTDCPLPSPSDAAREAYRYADAMLKEREK